MKREYGELIEKGLRALDKAIEINPQYADAMAYENLLIREQADLLDSIDVYSEQIALADAWVVKALAVKKEKADEAKVQSAKSSTSLSGIPTKRDIPGIFWTVDDLLKRRTEYSDEADVRLVTALEALLSEALDLAGTDPSKLSEVTEKCWDVSDLVISRTLPIT